MNKRKKYLIGVIVFVLIASAVWLAVAIERGFSEWWWLILVTIPLHLVIAVPVAYLLHKANSVFDKPIAYTVWTKCEEKEVVRGKVWGPAEKEHYTTFKVVYEDGTSTRVYTENHSETYEKLMKYWKTTE